MDVRQRIEKFNQENEPFYIVAHESGEYSLCFPLGSRKNECSEFGQEAFNCYAVRAGDLVTDGRFYTHGDGHEWRCVFEKAFEGEAGLEKITFDCEMGGFFCYSQSLDVIESYGRRFRELCMDGQKFTELVYRALAENSGQEMKFDM